MLNIDGVQIVVNSPYERELRQEILEKVTFLLSCIRGTIPMNRDIGLDPDIISAPEIQARNLYTISAIELIDKFEDRVTVEDVEFENVGSTGNIIPKVVLQYNDE